MNKFFRYPGHQKPDEYRNETDLYARNLEFHWFFNRMMMKKPLLEGSIGKAEKR